MEQYGGSMILRYMVNNDHIKLYQKNQPWNCVWAGNIAKFSFRGHPNEKAWHCDQI